MAHAFLTDVETVLMRPMSSQEEQLATKLLAVAVATLRRKVADLDTRMAESADYDSLVNFVESSAVARIIQNPGGGSYEAIGPYSIRGVSSDGSFAFLKSELSMLNIGTAFTIRPHMAPPTLPYPDSYPPWWYDFPTADGSL